VHEDGCGNDGPWTRWKTNGRFPTAPTALEIANDAIPTFPQPRRGAEKWKTKSTFLTFPLTVLLVVSKTQKGGLAADRFAPAPGSFFDEKMLQ
jgi:hypothetical protein